MSNVLTGRIGLSPTMIGRASALDRVRTVVDQADSRCSDLPAVALVAGEAGIGKTRLVREVLGELPAGVRVFSAAAEPGSLGRSFDLAAQLAPAGSAHPATEALAAIGRAAAAGGAVVVVEDLHWIDVDSATFIDDVARQAWPTLAIVATYRSSDLRRGAPGGDLVLRLERRNEVEHIRLDRLNRNEVGAMMAAIVGRPVSSAAVEAVTRRSGGVPFVVEELMRCADAEADDIFEVQLPWSLEEAVRQQLADLTPSERVLIDALAVFAQPAGFEVLTAITGLDEDQLLSQLRGLVERGVIVEPRDDRLWFGHALVADSVLHQLLGRERRRLHERCFETLGRVAPDDFAGLAHHAHGAGRYDEIVDIAVRGARSYLDRGSSFQALRLACDGLAEDGQQLDLLEVATEAAWRLDFQGEALDHAHRWLELATHGRSHVDAMRYVSRLHYELGDLTASDAVTDQLIAEVDALTSSDQADQVETIAVIARAEGAIAQLKMLRHQPDAVEWAERAIEHARAAGDEWVEVQGMVERASTFLLHTDRTTAQAALAEAVAAATRLADGVLLSRALNNMMELIPPASQHARQLRQQLRDTATASGFDKLGSQQVVWWDSLAAWAEGDLAAYRRLLDVWQSWRLSAKNQPVLAAELVSLHIEEGRVGDARELMSGLIGDVGCGLISEKPFVVGLLELRLAALSRDVVGGRTWFETLMAGPRPHDDWYVTSDIFELVWAALAVDIPADEVRRRVVVEFLETHPARQRLAATVEGLLLMSEQHHHEAVVALRAALECSTEHMQRPVIGTMLVTLAQAQQATGDRSGAQATVERAMDALARWPGWRRDRAEALAIRLAGASVRPVGELTARETEVAALIAEGLTNGQLAERLFISPKTAAVHVSNILAKLGLATRAEVAAWEIRRQLPAAGA
jgi:DNA-binding CsgD family transcriptional regulator